MGQTERSHCLALGCFLPALDVGVADLLQVHFPSQLRGDRDCAPITHPPGVPSRGPLPPGPAPLPVMHSLTSDLLFLPAPSLGVPSRPRPWSERAWPWRGFRIPCLQSRREWAVRDVPGGSRCQLNQETPKACSHSTGPWPLECPSRRAEPVTTFSLCKEGTVGTGTAPRARQWGPVSPGHLSTDSTNCRWKVRGREPMSVLNVP